VEAMMIGSAILVMLTAGAVPATTPGDYIRASKNGEFLSDYYPEGALKRGEQGTVGFRIGVEREGWVGSCEVTRSSGFKALDRETCEIIVQYAQVTPIVSADGTPVRALQDGYISWKLPQGTAKLATPSGKALRRPDPIVCRRDLAAGSMVAKTIQCLTKSEWELQQQFTRDAYQELQGKGHSNGT
jgi:TonB family protein